jgi:small subunit ribosomal protein S9
VSPETHPPSDEQREDDELTEAGATDASASDATPDSGEAAETQEPAEPEETPIPAEVAEEPASVAEEPAEAPAMPAPVAEEQAQPAPEAPAEPPAPEAPAEPPAAEAPAEAPTEPTADGAPEAPAEQRAEEPAAAPAEAPARPAADVQAEELPEQPRNPPEIPGADLIPDLAPPERDEFLDAEARAAAEAEAEARAAREREQEDQVHAEPIADAAIDLAAGARYSATGKRKSSVARVILKPGSGTYAINGKPLEGYFPRETLQRLIRQPLETVGYDARMDVVARMHGGGSASQAGALRHGISRALIVADPHLRGELKRRGFLTRDPRVKERKKAGLKKARKRPQFSKR